MSHSAAAADPLPSTRRVVGASGNAAGLIDRSREAATGAASVAREKGRGEEKKGNRAGGGTKARCRMKGRGRGEKRRGGGEAEGERGPAG